MFSKQLSMTLANSGGPQHGSFQLFQEIYFGQENNDDLCECLARVFLGVFSLFPHSLPSVLQGCGKDLADSLSHAYFTLRLL